MTSSVVVKRSIAVLPLTIGVVAASGLGFYAYNASRRSDTSTPLFAKGINVQSLKLLSSESVNGNVKRLRFELPDDNMKAGLPLTSALLTISRPEGRWMPVLRPYTPITDIDATGHVEFLVKQYPNGKASTHLHSLKPGDSLTFAGPIPGYRWTANKHRSINLLAGGSGITPIYQLIQGIMKNPEDKTKITLTWAVNTDSDIFLNEELKSLQQSRPGQLDIRYLVSNPTTGSIHQKGRINKDYLETQKLRRQDGFDRVLLCGPPAMEDALVGSRRQSGILNELGYSKEQVFKF